jgi:hypothetical protein
MTEQRGLVMLDDGRLVQETIFIAFTMRASDAAVQIAPPHGQNIRPVLIQPAASGAAKSDAPFGPTIEVRKAFRHRPSDLIMQHRVLGWQC